MRRFLAIALFAASIARAEPDIPAIRAAINSPEKEALRDDALSRQLEKWYSSFGHTIKIDHPRENGHYMMALMIATSTDFAQIVRQIPEATDPNSYLRHFLKEDDLTTLPFDPRRWTQKIPSAHLRYRMFKSFLTTHPPVGRTKAEIEAILGPSDAGYRDRFSYSLGADFGMGVEALFVDFMLKDAKVSEYRFRTP